MIIFIKQSYESKIFVPLEKIENKLTPGKC